jgi:hypothetical protein
MSDTNGHMQDRSFSPVIPLETALAPPSIGQILDRIFQLMKAHWRLFLGVAAIPIAAGAVIGAALLGAMLPAIIQVVKDQPQVLAATAGPPPVWLLAAIFGVNPLFLAIFAIYLAAASFAANRADRGVGVTVWQAYDEVRKRWGRYLYLMVLCVLCTMVPLLVGITLFGTGAAFFGLVHASPTAAFLLVPLFVMFSVGSLITIIVVMLRLAVAFPACVEEDLTAWAAVRRSFMLTRNSMGRIFVVMLVIYAITYAVILVLVGVVLAVVAIGAVVGIAAHVTPGSPVFYVLIGLGILIYALAIAIYTALSYAAITTAMAVIYHDQKRRIEPPASLQLPIQDPTLP